MTLDKLPFVVGVVRLNGDALLVAISSIAGVPLFAAFFPSRDARLAMPLLAVTSIGVYLTVPDVERVSLVMVIMVVAAVSCFATKIAPPHIVVAGSALLIMAAAIVDSGGRGAAIVRAAGCFGVLLAAPIAGWLNQFVTDGAFERRPALPLLAIVHCLVVGWSSRALIRETSVDLVVTGTAAALIVATVVLLGTSRPVAAEP